MVTQKKRALREDILEKLHAISDTERQRKETSLKDKLFGLSQYQKAHCVMFYVSKKYEINTHDMIDEAIAAGKRVVVPITRMQEKRLDLSELTDRQKELVEGHYGIHQPGEEHIRPVSPDKVDLILVPGLAFDKSGHRLGHGGGYYDRFLEKVPSKTYTVALAFDFQVVDKIPIYDTDIPVKRVLIS